MTDTKLNEEGYRVKAMMLGMQYGPSTHTFYHHWDDEHHDIDADTLEPVPYEEMCKRRDEIAKAGARPPASRDDQF